MINKTKVLIVEDETIVAMELKIVIEKLNCIVIGITHTKNNTISIIEKDNPNIIIMDIKLGRNQDGIDLVKEIMQTKKINVLYLTAFADDETMKRAFDTNPIGYIVKPFKLEELRVNIKLAIYKIEAAKHLNINREYINIGEKFYFDMTNQHLYYKDNFIKLSQKETCFLYLLIQSKHSTVTFSYLEEYIWNGYKPSSSALRTLVYRLKGKLGHNIIEATYGYGYNLKPL
ncbi:MAG: response regulator [Campylobacterales bacterium]|nr:response regulator [Campylobacterales bacterium]